MGIDWSNPIGAAMDQQRKSFDKNLRYAMIAGLIGLSIVAVAVVAVAMYKSQPSRPMGNPISPLGAPPEVVNVVAPGTFPQGRESRLKA
jgi:hypothetical protein